MTCYIEIPIKPYSVNAMYYRDGRRKKREAVQWEQSVSEYLRNSEIQSQLQKIRQNFGVEKNSICVDLEFQFPDEILFTQKGIMSSRAFDLSNMEKPLIDVIFLAKYSSSACKNLEIDDRYISKLSSSKTSGNQYLIKIKIELVALPTRPTCKQDQLSSKTAPDQDPEAHQDKEQL